MYKLARILAIHNILKHQYKIYASFLYSNGRKTYGHSLIVSPDGKILKELKKGIGVITANINPNISKILRKRIPSLIRD
jgi:predicted amidohydrolase